jgi:hypothetical protein
MQLQLFGLSGDKKLPEALFGYIDPRSVTSIPAVS